MLKQYVAGWRTVYASFILRLLRLNDGQSLFTQSKIRRLICSEMTWLCDIFLNLISIEYDPDLCLCKDFLFFACIF